MMNGTVVGAVVGTDRGGRITAFDSAAAMMFGHSRELVIGGRLAEAIAPKSTAHENGGELDRCLSGWNERSLGECIELSGLRADGSAFPVELAIAPAGTGEPRQAFTVFIRDVSDRKASEHLRLLIEAVKDYAIIMLDPGGHIATWNAGAAEFKGYAAEEIVGQHFSLFYPERERSRGRPERQLQLARELGHFTDEGWRVRKDGTEFWANVVITAVNDAAGNLMGFVKVTRDLTARRRAEQLEEREARRKSQELEEENRRMHEANRLKSEFLANMSHELRTPLNAIIGFADLMFKGKVGPVSAEHQEYLGDILTSSRHLLKLINDVLDLAKVESGKMEFRPVPLDLGVVVGEVSDILRGLASARRVRIEMHVDPGASPVVLDPSKLKQILYNYLSNALKFSHEGGVITVHVLAETDDRVRLEVEDRGIGICESDLHRLFVEFQQLDAGMAKKYAGTGLGLSLTKRIVEAQGGVVGVRSEPGKGSTFWAVLPRETSEGDVASAPDAAVARSPLAANVVVIDDDPAALRLMRALLKPSGHSVLGFADGASALRSFEESAPALVVLDLLMPSMNGFELLERLRELPHMRDVPVVVWTVTDVSESERKRLSAGAQQIVAKAHGDSDTILDAIEPYLAVAVTGGERAR